MRAHKRKYTQMYRMADKCREEKKQRESGRELTVHLSKMHFHRYTVK